MNNINKQVKDVGDKNPLTRSYSVKSKLSIRDFTLQVEETVKSSPLKRRKSMPATSNLLAFKPEKNRDKKKGMSKINQDVLEFGGDPIHSRTNKKIKKLPIGNKNEEQQEEAQIKNYSQSSNCKRQKFPLINQFKSVTLDTEIQKAISEKMKLPVRSLNSNKSQKIPPSTPDLNLIESNLIGKEDFIATQGNQKNHAEDSRKKFFISNLSLKPESDGKQFYENHNFVSKILNKFRDLQKRNKHQQLHFQKKFYGGGPKELVTKKFQSNQIKNIQIMEKKKKMYAFAPKKSGNNQIFIKEEECFKGWEAEEDPQNHYTWL